MDATEFSLLSLEEVPIHHDEIEMQDEEEEEEEDGDEQQQSTDASIGQKEKSDQIELPSSSETVSDATEMILDFIFQPREVEREDGNYRLQVSREPATREDVLNLEKSLNECLERRKARLVGLCPIRRELYDQCFDELIRQSTIRSPERGALMLRVRDELQMTIAAYEALYESGVAYGLRKFSEAESKERITEEQVRELESELRNTKVRTTELETRIKQANKAFNEQKAINEKRHLEKMEYLRKTNEQLKDQLDMMTRK